MVVIIGKSNSHCSTASGRSARWTTDLRHRRSSCPLIRSRCSRGRSQTEAKELTERIFDELQAKQEDIENDFKSRIDAVPDPEWHWRRWDKFTFSSINIRRDGSIDDSREKLEEIRAWMLDLLPKLKEVFDPRLEEILSPSSSRGDR